MVTYTFTIPELIGWIGCAFLGLCLFLGISVLVVSFFDACQAIERMSDFMESIADHFGSNDEEEDK